MSAKPVHTMRKLGLAAVILLIAVNPVFADCKISVRAGDLRSWMPYSIETTSLENLKSQLYDLKVPSELGVCTRYQQDGPNDPYVCVAQSIDIASLNRGHFDFLCFSSPGETHFIATRQFDSPGSR